MSGNQVVKGRRRCASGIPNNHGEPSWPDFIFITLDKEALDSAFAYEDVLYRDSLKWGKRARCDPNMLGRAESFASNEIERMALNQAVPARFIR